MNKVILCGRVTKDIEVTYSQSNNTAIAKFGIAVDGYAKAGQEKKADFLNCIAFGKTGEFVSKYFQKGSKILLEGRIQTGNYENKEGKKVYTFDIVVEQVEFVEKKSENSKADNNGFGAPGESDELPF
jgi:single-strand DNA-binding protein